jgi:undecaprenyl pyrophosphate phosphatase UppP
MSLRSDRAQRRASQLRTRRLILIIVALIIIAVIGYLIYTQINSPQIDVMHYREVLVNYQTLYIKPPVFLLTSPE